MTKDHLMLLDADEHLRTVYKENVQDIIIFAKKHNLIVNCATSDITIFLEDKFGNSIELT